MARIISKTNKKVPADRWKISFIKIQKYAFVCSFINSLAITNSFGKLAIWQTSFRKKLDF